MTKTTKKAAAPAPLLDDPMNAYAQRVWDGQSCSLPHVTRIERVKTALIAQGYDDHANLQLPESDQ